MTKEARSPKSELHCGDCLKVMAGFAADSIDAIVTDPPYGLEFMGKDWDKLGADVVALPAEEGGFQDGNGGKPYNRSRIRYGKAHQKIARANELSDPVKGKYLRHSVEYVRDPGPMQAWHYAWCVEALRVAKPGAHLLAFGGTRTFHRLACAIEDAGWEIRDCIMWVHGQGFPKSLDVSKAIDKAAGIEREVLGVESKGGPDRPITANWKRTNAKPSAMPLPGQGANPGKLREVTAPATAAARQWEGWGTALKPAWEPVIVARKPLDGTVAENVQKWGTGALNIDGCRIEVPGGSPSIGRRASAAKTGRVPTFAGDSDARRKMEGEGRMCNQVTAKRYMEVHLGEAIGRYPANLIHDGSEEVLAGFPLDTTLGNGPRRFKRNQPSKGLYKLGGRTGPVGLDHGDSGSAARFFYCAKADFEEREAGLIGFIPCCTCGGLHSTEHQATDGEGKPLFGKDGEPIMQRCRRNAHPTVKPVAVMEWLVRLVTRPDGLILDPFMGSGTTGVAAMQEGFRFVGIDQEAEYVEVARRRTVWAQGPLFAEARMTKAE